MRCHPAASRRSRRTAAEAACAGTCPESRRQRCHLCRDNTGARLNMRSGTVYTETVVHLAPERFAADVPYQVIIVELDGGGKVTARVEGGRVAIGDLVAEVKNTNGITGVQKS